MLRVQGFNAVRSKFLQSCSRVVVYSCIRVFVKSCSRAVFKPL